MANVRIPWQMFGWVTQALKQKRLAETPEFVERIVRAILEVANGGKYKDAQVCRLFQTYKEPHWIVTILHPLLPGCPENEEVQTIDLHFHQWANKVLVPRLSTLIDECLSGEEGKHLAEQIAERLAAMEWER